jgi:hypothetical protein
LAEASKLEGIKNTNCLRFEDKNHKHSNNVVSSVDIVLSIEVDLKDELAR